MPMFFLISGYLFKDNNEKWAQRCYRRAKSLLIPYISFFVLYIVICSIIHRTNYLLDSISFLVYNTSDSVVLGCANWFLTAMFFVDVIYFALNKMLKNDMFFLSIIIMVFSTIGTCILAIFGGQRLPFALDASFVGLGYYHIGRLLHVLNKENNVVSKLLKLKPGAITLLAIISLVGVYLNTPVNMRTAEYGNIILFWITGIGLSIVIWNISQLICNSKIGSSKVVKMLGYIGENSIVFLCLNRLVIAIVSRFVRVFGLSWLASKCLVFISSMFCLMICSKIIMKTPLKKIVGK